MFGTFVAGSEANGLLRLNSADGGLTQNALGQDRRNLHAALNTNTDSSDLDTGLKINDTLGLTGLFNLSSLTGPLINGYGIRFSDRAGGVFNQMAELDVRFNPVTGKVEVRYILQDFVTDQVTVRGLADFAPPNGADQILLQLTRPDTSNTNFFASYSYLQGGNVLGGGAFEAPLACSRARISSAPSFMRSSHYPCLSPARSHCLASASPVWRRCVDAGSSRSRPGQAPLSAGLFLCAPSMGAILEVQVLPRADHSERSEAQLREGDRAWGGSVERNRESRYTNRI